MKKTLLTFLIFLTFLVPMLCMGMLNSDFAYADERGVTVNPKKKRDLAVEAKKGLDTALLNAKYYALIIGNNNYKYIARLRTAIADAEAVDKLLSEQYGFQTKLLIDATRGDILDTLNDFRKIGENDNLLIYYAGHGEFEKSSGKAYWLPVDAKSDSPSNWIIADDITSSIKRITSRHILIVSDSCYSGTLTRAVSGDLSKAGEREEFIKKMMERSSRTLMASGGNEPVADESGSGHSVFADAFLRALKEADKSIFTAEELFHGRVKSSVAGKSDQVPEYNDIKNSGHDGGDFVFKLASVPLTPPSPLFNKEGEKGGEGVIEPEINVKEVPKTDFSLEDLDKKAKEIEDNKAAWGNTIKKMKEAFNKVSEYQKRDIEKDLKIAAWNKFLNSFPEDNPYSREDEAMRQKARQEMEKWQKVAMAHGARDTRDPVTGMEFVFVKGGCFQMGDTFGDEDSDEKPVHEVCVDDFYMGKYEVTQKQWQDVMGNNPSYFKNCDNCPVESVSWIDIQSFITTLTVRTGKGYRLPTEAEWEYAARSGGKSEKYAGGNDLDSVGWYIDNSGGKTHPVGQKRPNGFGLYDMSGNVWEWCQDWYDSDYYRKSPRDNPRGADSGQYRVLRGGSWVKHAWITRPADRLRLNPDFRNFSSGFRVVRTD